ncbi:MAG: GC-type dockerin domain-anchored protein [Phycisphaerales bacterium JB039]
MTRVRASCAAAALLVAAGAAGADVVTDWNTAVLDAIEATRTNPPMASRAMATMHAAVYDAVNGIGGRYLPYRVETAPPAHASREAAVAQAAHDTLVALFPTQAAAVDTLLDASLSAIPAGPGRDAGVAQGAFVAAEILAWRALDGSAASKPYTPTPEPGRWRPTPPGFIAALLPQWPDVTPFAMTSGSQFRPPAPPPLISPEYTAAFDEVKAVGRFDSATRTADQTEIARIWEGGVGTPTPPGQWNQIAQTLAAARGNTLEQNARMFALLNISLADAAISAWDCKYTYDYWRPVTAIQLADTDGNPDTIADPDWLPLLTTPPFPTYTSGHSTFSGSAAAVLAGFFGTDAITFTFEAIGLSRDFTSLREAAEEAGISRIYGGIHYSFDNTAGLDSGRQLGEYVYESFLGRACPADLDDNGALDFFDFLAFLNLYAAGDMRCDFTGDGVLDASDFVAFQTVYTAGCP